MSFNYSKYFQRNKGNGKGRHLIRIQKAYLLKTYHKCETGIIQKKIVCVCASSKKIEYIIYSTDISNIQRWNPDGWTQTIRVIGIAVEGTHIGREKGTEYRPSKNLYTKGYTLWWSRSTLYTLLPAPGLPLYCAHLIRWHAVRRNAVASRSPKNLERLPVNQRGR